MQVSHSYEEGRKNQNCELVSLPCGYLYMTCAKQIPHIRGHGGGPILGHVSTKVKQLVGKIEEMVPTGHAQN